MPIHYAGVCDLGQKRKTNQDAIYMNPRKKLFIVADGMGGHQGGEVASAMAVKHIPKKFTMKKDDDPQTCLANTIQNIHQLINEKSKQDSLLLGMGTTVCVMFIHKTTLYIGNVGDSRCYLINKREIFQLTKDHSMIQEKINMGIYTREEAAHDPQKNVLVRSVGIDEELFIDIFSYQINKDDIFLICSDGLYGMVHDADLLYLVNKGIPSPQEANSSDLKKTTHSLIDLANKNGGNDNISAVLVLAS